MNFHINRRSFLKSGVAAFSGLSLGNVLANEQTPHFVPKAKNVIFLHMVGAPSQLDLFDYKPELIKWHGKQAPEELYKGKTFAFITGVPSMYGTPYKFQRHGQSGQWMSELLPHLSKQVDEMAFIHSMHTKEFNHGPAQLLVHNGLNRQGNPSMGAWLSYALGTENKNLPPFVVMVSGAIPGAGAQLWNNGFLPSVHQGVEFRSEGDPVLFLTDPKGMARAQRRDIINDINLLNLEAHKKHQDPEALTRIKQYELAYHMQDSVPKLTNTSQEPEYIRKMYGNNLFGKHCLQARKLVENGVRFVELFNSDWDHHSSMEARLPEKCREVDQAIAALLQDLKQRGLLDETLVVWAAEFGRTPLLQGIDMEGKADKPGRDHHKEAFSVWMAGGGIKGGTIYGATDDLGYYITKNPTELRDFHATIMHQLGLDYRKVSFKYMGLDQRLTGVEEAHIIHDILA